MKVEYIQNENPPIHKKIKDIKIGETFTTGGALYVRVNPDMIDKNTDKIILFHLNNNYLYEADPEERVTMMDTKIISI